MRVADNPPTLLPPPRRVEVSKFGRSKRILYRLGFLASMLLLLMLGILMHQPVPPTSRVSAQAKVVETLTGHDDEDTVTRIVVQFQAEDRTYYEEIHLTNDEFDHYESNGYIPINYSPSNPTVFSVGPRNRPKITRVKPFDLRDFLLFVLLMAWFPLIPEWYIQRERRFLRDGYVITATVLSVYLKRKGPYMVSYEFELGDWRWVGAGPVSDGADSLPQQGDPIEILYLPKNPNRSLPLISISFVALAGGV